MSNSDINKENCVISMKMKKAIGNHIFDDIMHFFFVICSSFDQTHEL